MPTRRSSDLFRHLVDVHIRLQRWLEPMLLKTKKYNFDITYEILSHTHPGIVTTVEKGGYSPSKTDMELERDPLLNLSCIYSENHWRLMKYFTLKNN